MCDVTLSLSKCLGKPTHMFQQAQHDFPRFKIILEKLKKYLSILFFTAIYFIATSLSAQTDTIINGKHYKTVDETVNSKSKKYHPPTDSMFVLDNKKLKYYNNWLSGGAGVQQNLTYQRKPGFTGGINFNFHIKYYYFQMGLEINGEQFGYYSNYQFHGGYGKRLEDKDIHLAGFAGISYSTGYGKVGDTTYTRPYNEPGVYAQIEIVKKIAYDVGIGASIFADWNQEQTIIGARVILYFSDAYKGKKNDNRR